MIDKELIDYVKVQRGLGVKDSSIKKSLIEAGHSHEDVQEVLKVAVKKTSGVVIPKFNLSNTTVLSINIVIVLLVVTEHNTQSNHLHS